MQNPEHPERTSDTEVPTVSTEVSPIGVAAEVAPAKPYSQRRALCELWIFPILAALLPWRWAWRFYHYYLPASSLFGDMAERAWQGLQTAAPPLSLTDQPTFWLRHRLTRLLDHADVYLALLRPKFWVRRYVDFSGDWPLNENSAKETHEPEIQTGQPTGSQHGAFLALTFHWGCGLWSLWQLRQQGIRAHFLSIRLNRADFAHRPVEYRYAQLRLWLVQRLTRAQVIYTQGAAEKILQCWQRGEAVIALMDVPRQGHNRREGTEAMNVAGRPFYWPLGLPAMAVQQKIPVLFFAAHTNWATGHRIVEIGPAKIYTDPTTCLKELSEVFTAHLQADAASWHFAEFSDAFWGQPHVD